jgi:hypothetical protein
MEAPGRAVDMCNQQVLALPIHTIKASGEEAASSFVAVEERWGFGTQIPHAEFLFPALIPA